MLDQRRCPARSKTVPSAHFSTLKTESAFCRSSTGIASRSMTHSARGIWSGFAGLFSAAPAPAPLPLLAAATAVRGPCLIRLVSACWFARGELGPPWPLSRCRSGATACRGPPRKPPNRLAIPSRFRPVVGRRRSRSLQPGDEGVHRHPSTPASPFSFARRAKSHGSRCATAVCCRFVSEYHGRCRRVARTFFVET